MPKPPDLKDEAIVGTQGFLWDRSASLPPSSSFSSSSARHASRSSSSSGGTTGEEGGENEGGLREEAGSKPSNCQGPGHGLSSWVCVDVLRFGTADRERGGGLERGLVLGLV